MVGSTACFKIPPVAWIYTASQAMAVLFEMREGSSDVCAWDQGDGYMVRPRRGVPFEEAVHRWGNAESVARAQSELKALGSLNKLAKDAAYKFADRSLIAQLYDRSLFASGIHAQESSRTLIDPEGLKPSSASYDRSKGVLFTFPASKDYRAVEIFELHILPLNILSKPRWFCAIEDAEDAASKAALLQISEPRSASPLVFIPSSDYRHVRLNGIEYSLTAAQSRIVRELHAAQQYGNNGWLHIRDLRDRAGFESDKLSHLFRRMPNWDELILSDKRGFYRLNT